MLKPVPAHEDPEVLAHYEGLIRTTASRVAPHVEEDYDDVVQLLRIKVWRSLAAYNPAKCRTSRDSFVFSCVYNQSKDILKKKQLGLLFIEDLAPEGERSEDWARARFEAAYLVVEPDQEFQGVEDEGVELPASLSEVERSIIWLLYLDFSCAEIGREVGMTRRQVERQLKGIREKMAGWRPENTKAKAA